MVMTMPPRDVLNLALGTFLAGAGITTIGIGALERLYLYALIGGSLVAVGLWFIHSAIRQKREAEAGRDDEIPF